MLGRGFLFVGAGALDTTRLAVGNYERHTIPFTDQTF